MKTIVVYKSKSGFAKKYAEWIAEELSAGLIEASKVTVESLSAYDTVIYGGGLYVGGINGVKLITQNLDKLKGKKVVVFASGASPAREEAINEVRNKNFTPEQQQRIRFFYLRGGFDYSKLQPLDKVLMILLKLKIKRKRKTELNSDERGMLAAYDQPADFTRKKNIDELISYVTSKNGEVEI
jgi:menaquinone-dependent protoporphyrinogen IX oxidase